MEKTTHKGGRGHIAPYQSTHVRVPLPIKPKVELMIEEYKKLVLNNQIPEREKYNCPDAMTLTSLGEALAIAQDILKQKKSAKQSLEKLLTALYQGQVKL